jgi:hypothetical protein
MYGITSDIHSSLISIQLFLGDNPIFKLGIHSSLIFSIYDKVEDKEWCKPSGPNQNSYLSLSSMVSSGLSKDAPVVSWDFGDPDVI